MRQQYPLLSDEEITQLLMFDLDPAERQKLLDRLKNDPEAQKILAFAAAETDSDEGLSSETVDKLMKIVHAVKNKST